jgi:hypothetical protein
LYLSFFGLVADGNSCSLQFRHSKDKLQPFLYHPFLSLQQSRLLVLGEMLFVKQLKPDEQKLLLLIPAFPNCG